MKHKDCRNCFWADQCGERGKRCDDYYPLYGSEQRIENEYEKSLKERVDDYDKIVREMND